MRPRSDSESRGIYEVNMTPLIDVSLVLVVILMVATPMALQSSIALGSARRGSAEAARTAAAPVEIHIVSERRVQVDGTELGRDLLGPALRQRLAARPGRQVRVRCEAGVTHGAFVGVLDEAKQCGALGITVVGK